MEFLLDCGISEEVLRKILLNNSEEITIDAEWNIDRIYSSIEYLKEIGINCIDKILINRFDIVLRGRKSLEESYQNMGNKNVVNQINKDVKYAYYFDLY